MYKSNVELPDRVKGNLPKHAQDIYRESFNSALDHYQDEDDSGGDSREQIAHKVAWSAVKNKYEKENDHWVRRNE